MFVSTRDQTFLWGPKSVCFSCLNMSWPLDIVWVGKISRDSIIFSRVRVLDEVVVLLEVGLNFYCPVLILSIPHSASISNNFT